MDDSRSHPTGNGNRLFRLLVRDYSAQLYIYRDYNKPL